MDNNFWHKELSKMNKKFNGKGTALLDEFLCSVSLNGLSEASETQICEFLKNKYNDKSNKKNSKEEK